MEQKVVPIRNHSVFVRVSRGGNRQNLLFVHGLGVSSKYWLPLARNLKQNCNVYIPDLPGYGNSSKAKNAYSIEELATVLKDLVQSLGLTDLTLVGHSFGCQIIIDALHRFDMPEVERAILLGPTINRHERSKIKQVLRLLQDSLHEPAWMAPFFIFDYLKVGSWRMYQGLTSAVRDRPEDKAGSIHIPVLVVRGQNERIASAEWVRELAANLPKGELAEVPKGQHAVHLQAMDDTAKIIGTFAGLS